MTDVEAHTAVAVGVIIIGAIAALALVLVTAPYGRHVRTGWGPLLSGRLGWIVMESPALLGFAAIAAMGDNALGVAPLVMTGLWLAHYLHRTVVFPFRLPPGGRPMPMSVVAMGFIFNLINAWLNARWITHLGTYEADWLVSAPFIIGLVVFAGGAAVNLHADTALLRLRRPGAARYSVPRGGLFEWVSCPNYLGEIIEWVGWAVLTGSLAGATFAWFTACNLAPRARANHRWYREQFPDYPAKRRALVPLLW